MSLVLEKANFHICENKGTDQLRINFKADQRLCFCYTKILFFGTGLLIYTKISM